MRLLAAFANPGEAGFFQSLLQEAGIESDLQDGILDLGGVKESRVFVIEEDFDRAAIVLQKHRAVEASRAPLNHQHPAVGFPFLGITGLVALLWACGTVGFAVVGMNSKELWGSGPLHGILQLIGMFGFGLLAGLFWGALIGATCLAVKVTWNKLRVSSVVDG